MVSQVVPPVRREGPVVDLSKPTLSTAPEKTWDQNTSVWHIHNKWGLFAWLEFGLKICACFTAFIALTTINTTLKVSLVRIIELILFGPLLLGLILPLIATYSQKESFDFTYVVITFLAHIAVIVVLLLGDTGMSLVVFCVLMSVGEIFRLVFLEATPARKLPPTLTVTRRRMLLGFVFTYIFVYLVVAAMETMTVIDHNTQYISTEAHPIAM